jgi:hypothetical protein
MLANVVRSLLLLLLLSGQSGKLLCFDETQRRSIYLLQLFATDICHYFYGNRVWGTDILARRVWYSLVFLWILEFYLRSSTKLCATKKDGVKGNSIATKHTKGEQIITGHHYLIHLLCSMMIVDES